eukprot:TRINITY_DN3549_c0_g1_i3.p1 TRINITY_DN3549_c0_g1~~TRINITY_DN3549_c0_g1_i3.p1  ORF type:complete len:144 (-),score=16.85 TRINITY_DN3549_c0_g1_i3:328-759(-)
MDTRAMNPIGENTETKEDSDTQEIDYAALSQIKSAPNSPLSNRPRTLPPGAFRGRLKKLTTVEKRKSDVVRSISEKPTKEESPKPKSIEEPKPSAKPSAKPTKDDSKAEVVTTKPTRMKKRASAPNEELNWICLLVDLQNLLL